MTTIYKTEKCIKIYSTSKVKKICHTATPENPVILKDPNIKSYQLFERIIMPQQPLSLKTICEEINHSPIISVTEKNFSALVYDGENVSFQF